MNEYRLKDLLVLDIETAPGVNNLKGCSEYLQQLWYAKEGHRAPPDISPEEHYFNRAGILAEFGKIICISLGIFSWEKDELKFRVRSIAGEDEKTLLHAFAALINDHFNHDRWVLSGHNIREFDVPYICRRMLANGIALPDTLNFSGKKPWEVHVLDTFQQWKFGDYKNYTSLALLAHVLGIATPKDDIDGSMVGKVFWVDNDLPRIVRYCQKDVLTVAQIIRKFRNEPLLTDEQVVWVDGNL